MASMRHELEQRRDGMWTGAHVTLLLVVPAAYSAVLVPGLVLKALVVAAAMGLALAGYVLSTSARRLEVILDETVPGPTPPGVTPPPAEVEHNP
ncbi:hypothetical protein [Cellulomonas septica]|uniref:Uncharacterized protein n=1 Tax=Cellulomonas septica TaxID=285080 RepID=A0ABX1K5K7_9CELL|nr:hypothetical protein [Cellulomonas septica]NKY40293.1 hypothetical protein [Cellulomonas septica]